jgi:hypothetical protein
MKLMLRMMIPIGLSAFLTVPQLADAQSTTTQPAPPAATPPVVVKPIVPAPATPPVDVKPVIPAPASPPVVAPEPAPVSPPVPGTSAPQAPAAGDQAAPDPNVEDPSAADMEGDISIGDNAPIEVEELTPELARKALDAYVLVQDKYRDSSAGYQDLQEFVDKDPRGKEFETDVKGFGFKNVDDWNLAITTLSLSYTNVANDLTVDTQQQIEDIKNDNSIAQDLKDQKIANLKASIPSDNNRKITEDLIKDASYSEKIKQLESTEE